MIPPLRVLGDRVLIRAEIETHVPVAQTSGLLTATTLAAAVDGEDRTESWCQGDVVQVGPAVNVPDGRRVAIEGLRALLDDRGPARPGLAHLLDRLERLPATCGEPLLGHRVVFSWQSGQRVTVDGVNYLIMSARDILARIDDASGGEG